MLQVSVMLIAMYISVGLLCSVVCHSQFRKSRGTENWFSRSSHLEGSGFDFIKEGRKAFTCTSQHFRLVDDVNKAIGEHSSTDKFIHFARQSGSVNLYITITSVCSREFPGQEITKIPWFPGNLLISLENPRKSRKLLFNHTINHKQQEAASTSQVKCIFHTFFQVCFTRSYPWLWHWWESTSGEQTTRASSRPQMSGSSKRTSSWMQCRHASVSFI